jgi:hypothetical protein
MSRYDHSDFLENPKKYQLYTSAEVARHLFGENGQDVPEGTPVGVKFVGVVRNQLYRRDEPIYQLTTGHVVYANCLSCFVL